MAEHTPTPWRASADDYRENVIHIHGADGTLVVYFSGQCAAHKDAEANAAFIVKAVNRDHLFKEMVNVLRDLIDRGGVGVDGELEDRAYKILEEVGVK